MFQQSHSPGGNKCSGLGKKFGNFLKEKNREGRVKEVMGKEKIYNLNSGGDAPTKNINDKIMENFLISVLLSNGGYLFYLNFCGVW